MANALETSLIIRLSGNIDQQAARYSRSIDQMARSSSRSLNLMRGSVAAMGRGLDMIGNRFTAILAGGGLSAAAMQVADFDAQMVRMGTDVGMSAEQVKKFKSQILSVANAPDIRIGNADLGASIAELLAKAGDIEFAEENIRNLAIGIQGFGADAKDVARMVGVFHQKQIRDVAGVELAYDRLYEQFAKGSVSVADIARESEKLFSLTRRDGVESIAEMGALMQIFVKTTGSAAEATTSIKAVMNSFSDLGKLEILKKNGIKVFEGDGKTLRDMTKLLPEIVNAAGKSDIKLRQVFDDTAMQGLRALYPEANQRLLEEMATGTVQLGRTQRAAAENANTFKASLQSLTNVIEKLADKKLSGPIQSVADYFNETSPERQDEIADDIWDAGVVGGAAILGRKAWNMLPDAWKKKAAMGLGLARNVPIGAIASMGMGATAAAAAQVGAVGYAAYEGTGWLMRTTGLDDKLSQSALGDAIGRAIAMSPLMLAISEDARYAVARDMEAKLNIAFDTSGMPYIKNVDTNGFDVNVEAGGAMQ